MNKCLDEKKESGDYILTSSHDEYGSTHYLIELDNGQTFHIDVGRHKPRVFINERPSND